MPGFETEEDFRRQAEPHRRELAAHCYRMVGSLPDADDLAQEALVRAWRGRAAFEGRSSVRTWLYKIATNACLDFVQKRPSRSLPPEVSPPSDPHEGPAQPVRDPVWLTPAPDDLFSGSPPAPDARYSVKESVALAFLTALQVLPPKQRAVLLLHDVLGWSAAEVADLLELTSAAVNSALQRARGALDAKTGHETEEPVLAPTDDRTRSLLQRYIRTWEEADITSLVALLREDAAFAMPPMPTWYRGRDDIRTFLSQALLAGDARGRFRLLPTAANGQPAVAIYQKDPLTGDYGALGIQLLDMDTDQIGAMTTFVDPTLFARFSLPQRLAP